MTTVIRPSDLDFDNIKQNLITYFKQKSEFKDYNFEASGLSNLMDVLAYNTHLNGLIANFALNESFLPSSQLRSSVVSHAEVLGYFPRSKTSATANVKLEIDTRPGGGGVGSSTAQISLPKNTTFSTTLENTTYTFQTLETYLADNDGTGVFKFKTSTGSESIPIREGTLRTKTFIVGQAEDEQVFIIPDEDMDTTTVDVKVFDTTTSSTFTNYSDINKVVRVSSNSTVFILREIPSGEYELTFSDGNVLGKSPVAGNKIVVTYLSTNGAEPNEAGGTNSPFAADNTLSVDGTGRTVKVTLDTAANGGAEKESISSIKANAPITFATQQRLVTADDYKALISERYSSVVQDVIAWGGQDNVPAQFGTVYVSLNFKSGVDEATKTNTKNNIQTVLSENLGIMSIDTRFTDPENTFLELEITFNFDPDLSGSTVETAEQTILTKINEFFTSNLSTFDAVFRKSILLAEIDTIDPAILNSQIDVKAQQRLLIADINVDIKSDYKVNFPIKLSIPDDVNHIITSSNFSIEGSVGSLRNKLSSTTLEFISATGVILKDNIGSYNPGTGEVSLTGVSISSVVSDTLKISATPEDQGTIKPLRNYIISLDASKSRAKGTNDFQNTSVTL